MPSTTCITNSGGNSPSPTRPSSHTPTLGKVLVVNYPSPTGPSSHTPTLAVHRFGHIRARHRRGTGALTPNKNVPSPPKLYHLHPWMQVEYQKLYTGIVKGKAKGILGHVGKLIKQVICMIPIFPCSRKKPSSKEPANDEMSIPVPVGPEKTAPNTPPKEEVGSEDRYTPEIANKWAEPVHMNGPQVIPWSTTQFCERIVDHFAPMAAKYQKAKEPALQFLDDCTVFFQVLDLDVFLNVNLSLVYMTKHHGQVAKLETFGKGQVSAGITNEIFQCQM